MDNSYINIDGWQTHIRFSAAHVIPEYEKCGRLHGHTYAVHAIIAGIPDESGIIIDFSYLKSTLSKIVNELDHKIIIPSKNKVLSFSKEDTSISLSFRGKTYVFPLEDCILLPIPSSSAENLSLYILRCFIKEIGPPSNISSIEIGVDEGYGQGARVRKDFHTK